MKMKSIKKVTAAIAATSFLCAFPVWTVQAEESTDDPTQTAVSIDTEESETQTSSESINAEDNAAQISTEESAEPAAENTEDTAQSASADTDAESVQDTDQSDSAETEEDKTQETDPNALRAADDSAEPASNGPVNDEKKTLTDGAVVYASSFKEIEDAINQANNNESIHAISIYLTADINMSLKLDVEKAVTIYGEGHSLKDYSGNYMFSMDNGGTLNLGSDGYTETLDLIGNPKGMADCLITVNHGTLNMYNGVTIRDNQSGGTTGGIAVENNSTLNFREICN